MKPTFRSTMLAAALAACACGAFATPVVLNFEALGATALSTGQPVAVSSVLGFDFTGAFAYEYDMIDKDPFGPDFLVPSSNTSGFIVNRDRAMAATGAITLTLDKPLPGQFFQSISFQLFTSDANTRLKAFNAKGLVADIGLSAGGLNLWSSISEKLFDLQEVSRVEFVTVGGGVFGLDNLSITLTDTNPGGGTVPEPAGYALVGLALLAAGSASRRSR